MPDGQNRITGRRATDRDPIYERVAVLEHVAADLVDDVAGGLERTARLEAERSANVQIVAGLHRDFESLRAELPRLAGDAVLAALEHRDESAREQLQLRRGGLSLRMQAVAVAFGSAGSALGIAAAIAKWAA